MFAVLGERRFPLHEHTGTAVRASGSAARTDATWRAAERRSSGAAGSGRAVERARSSGAADATSARASARPRSRLIAIGDDVK